MAKTHILAFRVSNQDGLQEGFDDDGEEGAGEKLLSLLQKMEVENILIVVCIWDKGVKIGNTSSIVKGGEFYKILIDRARELLNQIQQ